MTSIIISHIVRRTVSPPTRACEPPVPQPGVRYFLGLFTVICVLFTVNTGVSFGSSLGFPRPEKISEHTTLCNTRPAVVTESEANNLEQWSYWGNVQRADLCNLIVQQREELKSELESAAKEYKEIKEEIKKGNEELGNIKKQLETVVSSVKSLGSESSPLYTTSSSSSPSSKVEVASFTGGATEDLSQIKVSMETVGWCLIGTIIAAMVSVFAYMIIKPAHK